MKRVAIIPVAALVLSTTACSGVLSNNVGDGDQGRILIHADTEGMRAFGDTLVGLVNETKSPAEMESAHYQLRKEQVRTRALRFVPVKRKGGK